MNNLDSCDLDDDDLMLDADVLEDASLHSGMLVSVYDEGKLWDPLKLYKSCDV